MSGNISASGLLAGAKVVESSIEATITRADGRVEHLGTISYFHRNPLRRLAWRISRWLKGY